MKSEHDIEAALSEIRTAGKLERAADAIEERCPELAPIAAELRGRALNRGRRPSKKTQREHMHLARFLRYYWKLLAAMPTDDLRAKCEACEQARRKFERMPDGDPLDSNVAYSIAVRRRRTEIIELAEEIDDDNDETNMPA